MHWPGWATALPPLALLVQVTAAQSFRCSIDGCHRFCFCSIQELHRPQTVELTVDFGQSSHFPNRTASLHEPLLLSLSVMECHTSVWPVQEVVFKVDYAVPSIHREFGSVFLGSTNLALDVVAAGWAKVRHRPAWMEQHMPQEEKDAGSFCLWRSMGCAECKVEGITLTCL